MKKLAVLVSGTGSLLLAMIRLGVPIEFVLADRMCGGLLVASNFNIPHMLIDRIDFSASFNRVSYTRRVVWALRERGIELIAMAGYMTRFEWPMFKQYPRRILNTHPSLLPKHKGAHAVRDTLRAGDTVSGCTIHFATITLDSGPIIAQARVPVHPDDTEESLHERIKAVERELYPRVILEMLSAR